MATSGTPGLNRVARLQGRTTPRAVKTVDRPPEEWLEIPVPAIVDQDTFARVQQRPEDNKRFAARNTKVPSLLQGLAACSACGYGYYRTSARTARRKIYYYRCLGSDDYRYEGGRVDRKSTRLNSSHGYISYAVFCLKKKKKSKTTLCRSKTNKKRNKTDHS